MMEPSILSPEASPQSAPTPLGNCGGGALVADAETLPATDSQLEMSSGNNSVAPSKSPSSPIPSVSGCQSESRKTSHSSVYCLD